MKLSDFQAQLTPIVFDPSIMERNATRAATQIDWKDTKIARTKGGSLGCFLKDAEGETKVKVRYKGSESDEPEEETDSDEEPDEEAAMDALEQFVRTLIASDSSLKSEVLAVLKRDRARQPGDSRIVTSDKSKLAHSSGFICDQEMIASHLNPNELCVAAENRLRQKAFDAQANNPNRSYWSGLFEFLRNQPEGSRIKDIKNKVCLSTLIAKTLAA